LNIRFGYLYRDAGNFKSWGEVVFTNKNKLYVGMLIDQAESALIDGEFFIANKASLPNLYFQNYVKSLDHGWHEFHLMEESEERENDTLSRDIEEFMHTLKYASTI